MNELEKALSSMKDDELDFYLEMTNTGAIRRDIEEIKQKAIDQRNKKIEERKKALDEKKKKMAEERAAAMKAKEQKTEKKE